MSKMDTRFEKLLHGNNWHLFLPLVFPPSPRQYLALPQFGAPKD
jgi:hypothetical protein